MMRAFLPPHARGAVMCHARCVLIAVINRMEINPTSNNETRKERITKSALDVAVLRTLVVKGSGLLCN